MNFALATAALDAAFTKLTTTKNNLYTQLRQQEDRIHTMQAELCNLKVVEATQITNVKVNSSRVHPYASEKKRNHSGQLIPWRKYITAEIFGGTMGMLQATQTHWRHSQEHWLNTRRRLCNGTQWDDKKNKARVWKKE